MAQEELRSLPAERVLEKLDLDRPGLETVRAKAEAGDRTGALAELLRYYRNKYPLPKGDLEAAAGDFPVADRICEHVFQWGPYEPADYGDEIDWEWDPRGDIEWVAAVYRFYWAPPLAEAYRRTRDEKYARAFVELTSDWIAKHPLEKRHKAHPVYTRWRGFAWLDIQTGIRADNLSKVFPVLVHGEAFTPEFLGVLLASLYDHQVKTEKIPMGAVHNKAIFEQRGFVNLASTFPEFRDARRWMELALERTRESFLAQTTPDGVQREWSFGYNLAVLRDAVDIMQRAESMGIAVAGDYRQRVRAMYDYLFAIATPDLAGPMFGDASRSADMSQDRSRWPLYRTLSEATELLDDPKYAARAKLDRAALPEQTSYAFSDAGMYVLRNDWGPEQTYMAVHCSPRGISGHDQPDNATFELFAYGRWLMPDSGYYTYGHDPKGRRWHRQTRVHQTLTLDGKDTQVAGRHLLWHTSPEADVLVVENASYEGLTHRRTVWFVKGQGSRDSDPQRGDKISPLATHHSPLFFVLLDEAIGDVPGALELHFQLAPGDARINTDEHWAATAFDDANVLVWTDPQAPVTMQEEEGWYGCHYGHREPRKAFCYRHNKTAPAVFLTFVVPYRGVKRPEVSALLEEGLLAGNDHVDCWVQAFGKTWHIGRDLNQHKAWCVPTQ
jgi:heparan-sulfate lyase